MSQTKEVITPQALTSIFAGKLVRFKHGNCSGRLGVCQTFGYVGQGTDLVAVRFTDGFCHAIFPHIVTETSIAEEVYEGCKLELILTAERMEELTNVIAMLQQGIVENRQNEVDWNQFMLDALMRMHELTSGIFGK